MNTISKWLMALALLSGPVVAEAALITVDNGLGVYDSTYNLTWVSDANLFGTQVAANPNVINMIIADAAGLPVLNGYTLSASDFTVTTISAGAMTWYGAQAWVHYLNVTNYGGSNQWALPTTVDSESSDAQYPSPSSSQMASLFIGSLRGTATGPGNPGFIATLNSDAGKFTNLQTNLYWSGTLYSPPPPPAYAWFFSLGNGAQAPTSGGSFYALAVAPGEVSPLNAAALLAALLTEVTGVGPGKSLADKVTAAQAYYAASDTQATCAMLTGLVNEVQAQNGKKISQQLDAKIITDTQTIESAIGCQ